MLDDPALSADAIRAAHRAIHPAFTIRWDILPMSGDIVGPGEAEANVDFGGTFDNTLTVPENAATIPFPVDDTDDLPDAPDTVVYPDSIDA